MYSKTYIKSKTCIYFLVYAFFHLVFASYVVGIAGAGGNHIHVQTTSGQVSGFRAKSPEGGEVTRFYGIPYAEKPTGASRFRPTRALLDEKKSAAYSSEDVNSETLPPACPQTQHLPEFSHESLPQGGIEINEDCLKLNIYAPVLTPHSTEKFPILIWIPGEGFNYADIIQYDGSTLAAKGRIIVVTVNYRVGVFGFMSSGNGTLPGNAGLHDILNAIRWVRANAVAFQGDVNNITLGGRFSGAMAISALVVSPMFLETTRKSDNTTIQNNLARRVILHGGIATGRYVLDHKPLEGLNQLANITHCRKPKLNDTILCLQELPYDLILNESMKIPQPWKPVLDRKLLPGDPLNQLEEDKYPYGMDLLIGDNDGAGSLCFLTHSYLRTQVLSRFKSDTLDERDLKTMIKQSLKEFYALERENDELASVATHEYLFLEPGKSHRETYLRFCGAMYIRYPVQMAALSVARSNQTAVYRYQWTYRPTNSPNPKWLHAAIGEEVVFAFPNNGTKFISKGDSQMRDKFMEVFINFVKTGNPSPGGFHWPRFEYSTRKIVSFGHPKAILKLTTCYPSLAIQHNEEGMALADGGKLLDRDVHFWHEVINPLAETYFEKTGSGGKGKMKACPTFVTETQRSVLSQAILAIVILMAITLIVVFVYFCIKNWGKPRSMWRF